MSKQVTISIVTYNPGDEIITCLDSLKAQTFQDFEVIIIDNASTDNSIDKVQRNYPEITILHQENNLGFGKAHNIAIRKTDSPWVLVLNQDVILEPTALEEMMKFTSNKSLASIGPKLYLTKDQKNIDTTGIKKLFFFHYKERMDQQDQQVWGISGSCALYRKEALDSVAYANSEYFDEFFFMYKEDIDLAERLNKKGWKAQFASTAIGYHNRTASKSVSRFNRPEYIKQHSYKNHLFVVIKHATLITLPFVFIYECLKFLFLLFTSPKTLMVLLEVVKLSPKMLKRRYV